MARFGKLYILILVCLVMLLPFKSFAFPIISSFDSSGWVNPNHNNSWDPINLTGTARYSFNIYDTGIDVYNLSLRFDGDIFDLTALSANEFNIINPGIGWTASPDSSNLIAAWWNISDGATTINSTNDPILIDVNYTLLSSDAYYYGNSLFAGDGSLTWAWDEAQGGNTSWNQAYTLIGHGSGIYISGGSTAPIPEPVTFLLLGSGVVGVVLYARKKKCLINI